jgi:hypothetical protein
MQQQKNQAEPKNQFYEQLDVKHSLHESTNENGLRLVDFAANRQMAITNKSTSKPDYPQMETPSTRSITA